MSWTMALRRTAIKRTRIDLDKMFGAWLGELDKLTQVRH